ncbi:MAG: hypothetical protein KF764_03815 [Labilithrix sp.]|nr:hypothetical protein [Labilithrix sp.]MBX3222212.1 hypothetical protein [Labilithrix sp.]
MRAALPLLAALVVLGACGPAQEAETTAGTGPSRRARGDTPPVPPDSTRVTAFSVDPENLNVDKIAMRDGGIRPDGNRDLVFRATVEGPADALYIVTTSDKGEPHYGFRADTISGHEELPSELGSVVDVGRLTVWIAVVEDGKFINTEGGALGNLSPGPHQLKLYVPNTGNLRPGSHLRLYARAPNGGLAKGPVIPY